MRKEISNNRKEKVQYWVSNSKQECIHSDLYQKQVEANQQGQKRPD